MPNAMKVCCNPDDLRRRGSAVRGSSGYADLHGGCSNRNALPICATRQPRQFAAQSSCCLVKVESAACSQSRRIFMRLQNCAHPAISCDRTLTSATFAGAAARSLWPPAPPASQRARRDCAPLVGSARPDAILLQQPRHRAIGPRSSGGTIATKGGPHNIVSPAPRKVNRDRPHYQALEGSSSAMTSLFAPSSSGS